MFPNFLSFINAKRALARRAIMLVWCPNWIICMIENYLRFLSHAIRLSQLLQSRKGESHSAEKSGNLLLRNACKKISAYAPVRTRTLWVESKHLTTRQRTPELCELQAETRVVARKKSTSTFP